MDIKEFIKSGKQLLVDTKARRPTTLKESSKVKSAKKDLMMESEVDPIKRLIHQVIKEKPSKTKLVEEFKRFTEAAEAAL
jgi:hypothetical protein